MNLKALIEKMETFWPGQWMKPENGMTTEDFDEMVKEHSKNSE